MGIHVFWCLTDTVRTLSFTSGHEAPEGTVELTSPLTVATPLSPVSAESPSLVTLLQSLAVLRLNYSGCHFLCSGPAASRAA